MSAVSETEYPKDSFPIFGRRMNNDNQNDDDFLSDCVSVEKSKEKKMNPISFARMISWTRDYVELTLLNSQLLPFDAIHPLRSALGRVEAGM